MVTAYNGRHNANNAVHRTGHENAVEYIRTTCGLTDDLCKASFLRHNAVSQLVEVTGKDYRRGREVTDQLINTRLDVVKLNI